MDGYKGKVEANEGLRDQAVHKTYQQFYDAGDIEQVCKEMLLETQDERVSKNEEENATVQEITNRLFADKEALDRLVSITSRHAYEHFNKSQAQ
jgi:hypothetical protein